MSVSVIVRPPVRRSVPISGCTPAGYRLDGLWGRLPRLEHLPPGLVFEREWVMVPPAEPAPTSAPAEPTPTRSAAPTAGAHDLPNVGTGLATVLAATLEVGPFPEAPAAGVAGTGVPRVVAAGVETTTLVAVHPDIPLRAGHLAVAAGHLVVPPGAFVRTGAVNGLAAAVVEGGRLALAGHGARGDGRTGRLGGVRAG